MMRWFQRINPDGDLYDIWINSDHVISVFPNGDGPQSWIALTPRAENDPAIKVKGYCGDIAKELNGYFDE